MHNIEELEEFVIHQSLAEDEQTFLYQLYECDIFDKTKFDQLLMNCQILIKDYRRLGKTENYPKVVKGILLIFEYTLFLFYCNANNNDLFKIINLIDDDISAYYNEIRAITDEIIF